MCSYCGCDAVEAVGRFMSEHAELVNRTGDLRHACEAGDQAAIDAAAARLDELLTPHAQAEEAGIFTVLRELEEFTPTIDRLVGEHRRIDELLAAVRRDPAAFDDFDMLLRDHFDREENGLFPASAIELADGEWERVHELTPAATWRERDPEPDDVGRRVDDPHRHDHPHDHSHAHDHRGGHVE